MKKYGIIVLVLLITAILSGCISKPEPKFKEGDIIKYTIVQGSNDYYKKIVSYNADTDEYILARIDSGKEIPISRELLEGRFKAELVARVPEGYVMVDEEDPGS